MERPAVADAEGQAQWTDEGLPPRAHLCSWSPWGGHVWSAGSAFRDAGVSLRCVRRAVIAIVDLESRDGAALRVTEAP